MTDTPIKSMAPNADDRSLHTDITATLIAMAWATSGEAG